MEHFNFIPEGAYEDASVPSIADLEKLALPDFNSFGNDIQPFMEYPTKVKTEPMFEEPPVFTTQQTRFFNFAPTPSTPLYSPALTSNQSSPASFTDEDFSEEDKSFCRSSNYQMAGIPGNIASITDEQLSEYSARDINRLCKGYPEETVKQLKKRRRTLKNRGYASNSRVRRLQQKNELETTKNQLQMEVQKLRQEVIEIKKQRDYYKNRAEVLAKKAGQK